jgi:hypothetical protein
MFNTTEADRLARILADRLGPELLAQVIGKLLDQPEPQPLPIKRYRKRDFKAALGDIGDTKWSQLRGAGLIPNGMKLSPQLELWTLEQVLATVAHLAELEEARRQALAEEARAKAEAEGVPPPPQRSCHLKTV